MKKNKQVITSHLPGMLTCQQVDHFILDYCQGELPLLTKIKFTLHLTMCRSCRLYLKRYRQTILLARQTNKNQQAPLNVPDNLVRTILQSQPSLKKHKKDH